MSPPKDVLYAISITFTAISVVVLLTKILLRWMRANKASRKHGPEAFFEKFITTYLSYSVTALTIFGGVTFAVLSKIRLLHWTKKNQ